MRIIIELVKRHVLTVRLHAPLTPDFPSIVPAYRRPPRARSEIDEQAPLPCHSAPLPCHSVSPSRCHSERSEESAVGNAGWRRWQPAKRSLAGARDDYMGAGARDDKKETGSGRLFGAELFEDHRFLRFFNRHSLLGNDDHPQRTTRALGHSLRFQVPASAIALLRFRVSALSPYLYPRHGDNAVFCL